MPNWHVFLGEGTALAFPLLGCLPHIRAQLCVLSILHLPTHLFVCLSVCLFCLSGSLCVGCEGVHPVAVVPGTASSPGRKQ